MLRSFLCSFVIRFLSFALSTLPSGTDKILLIPLLILILLEEVIYVFQKNLPFCMREIWWSLHAMHLWKLPVKVFLQQYYRIMLQKTFIDFRVICISMHEQRCPYDFFLFVELWGTSCILTSSNQNTFYNSFEKYIYSIIVAKFWLKSSSFNCKFVASSFLEESEKQCIFQSMNIV